MSEDKNNNFVKLPKHVAVILDGNGRWAEENGHTRNYGHRKGCEALVRLCKCARKSNIKILSVYAFSTENWKRPKKEVDYLMKLIEVYFDKYIDDLVKYDYKVNILGRKEDLSISLREKIDKVQTLTKDNKGCIFNICFNYGSKEEITQAFRTIYDEYQKANKKSWEITEEVIEKHLYTKDLPPVDLLIRTSGEMRVSNFLLWQIAYAEMYFPKVYFPDFTEKDFKEALASYQSRKRRFGGLNK